MIPFLSLKAGYLELKKEFDEAYHRVMESGWFLLGEETEAFESEYANYCDTKHCITVANGMDALVLSLLAYDIGAGDEVIVPSHTFIASWLAVTQVGATPVPVEPCCRTYNLDPDKVQSAITDTTRAIMPVHLYGQPAQMAPLLDVAEKHNLIVLEDAAQSQGARYAGKRSGSLGHIAAHSFYPGKNLGAFSDGGAVTTNDTAIADRVRMLRNYGSKVKYHHEVAGVNSRIDEYQAAVLRIKLKYLDQWNARRSSIASDYLKGLMDVPGITLPYVVDEADPVWHLFVIRHPSRDRLQEQLKRRGVSTLIHYPVAAHLAGAYQHMELGVGSFPISEDLASSVLSLPVGPQQSAESTAEVIAAVREVCTCESFKP